jgi:hypothetical protein
MLLGQFRQRANRNAVIDQRLGVGGAGLPIDAARLDLAIMDLTGFLGETRPDIIGIVKL